METHQLSWFGESSAPDCVEHFDSQQRIVVHLGDALGFLKTLPSESIALVITSPPYNLGKEYETRKDVLAYLQEQEAVIDEIVRVTSPEGSICWQVGNFVEDGEVFPLDIFYYDIFKKKGLKLRNRIIWRYSHGMHMSRRFSGRYETILWFTRGDHYTFHLDPVRVPSKYPGKRHYKGPRKGAPSGNPLGKNPSDFWEVVAQDWEEEVWYIPNVKAAHPEKTSHPCQYPVELAERCVLALTNEDEWVLDPYCGAGSSLIAGIKHGRRVAGCDKEEAYINITRERIRAFFEGRLPLRPLGRELYRPSGKVARVPIEWEQGAIPHAYGNARAELT
jgi:adenine-specific DNA-methyltransferase